MGWNPIGDTTESCRNGNGTGLNPDAWVNPERVRLLCSPPFWMVDRVVRLQLGKLWTGQYQRVFDPRTIRHFAPPALLYGEGGDVTKGDAGESPAGYANLCAAVSTP